MTQDSHLPRMLEQAETHDHLCLIYQTKEEQFAALTPFIRTGLERGERCLYLADENTASEVSDALRAHGIPVEAAVASGALTITTPRQSGLNQGSFDLESMIHLLTEAKQAAKAARFTALRATGEMTWMPAGGPGAERRVQHESRLDGETLALCQYNRNRFKPEILREVIRTHPFLVFGGAVCRNRYYVPPAELQQPDPVALEVERWLNHVREWERTEQSLRQLSQELTERVEACQGAEEQVHVLNTELKRQGVELTAQWEAANKELEALNYSVSHDLRAPLRHIAGFVELLSKRTGAELDEKGRRYMATILRETERMDHLMDELLALSRLNRSQLHPCQVNMEESVKAALVGLGCEMAKRNIIWNIGPLPQVVADPQLLRLVWMHLVSNALKFTQTRSQAEIQIGGSDRDKEAVFFIRDNGVGFDMKYGAKLFGVFQRLHRAEEFEGTGTGLAKVQRIIHRHGGRTWAEGTVEAGATFYFSLPK